MNAPSHIHELLSAYLDGELTPDEQVDVERALLDSPELRQELEDLRSLSEVVRAADPYRGGESEQFVRDVQTRLHGAMLLAPARLSESSAAAGRKQWSFRVWAWAIGAHAAAVLAFVGLAHLLVPPQHRELANSEASRDGLPAEPLALHLPAGVRASSEGSSSDGLADAAGSGSVESKDAMVAHADRPLPDETSRTFQVQGLRRNATRDERGAVSVAVPVDLETLSNEGERIPVLRVIVNDERTVTALQRVLARKSFVADSDTPVAVSVLKNPQLALRDADADDAEKRRDTRTESVRRSQTPALLPQIEVSPSRPTVSPIASAPAERARAEGAPAAGVRAAGVPVAASPRMKGDPSLAGGGGVSSNSASGGAVPRSDGGKGLVPAGTDAKASEAKFMKPGATAPGAPVATRPSVETRPAEAGRAGGTGVPTAATLGEDPVPGLAAGGSRGTVPRGQATGAESAKGSASDKLAVKNAVANGRGESGDSGKPAPVKVATKSDVPFGQAADDTPHAVRLHKNLANRESLGDDFVENPNVNGLWIDADPRLLASVMRELVRGGHAVELHYSSELTWDDAEGDLKDRYETVDGLRRLAENFRSPARGVSNADSSVESGPASLADAKRSPLATTPPKPASKPLLSEAETVGNPIKAGASPRPAPSNSVRATAPAPTTLASSSPAGTPKAAAGPRTTNSTPTAAPPSSSPPPSVISSNGSPDRKRVLLPTDSAPTGANSAGPDPLSFGAKPTKSTLADRATSDEQQRQFRIPSSTAERSAGEPTLNQRGGTQTNKLPDVDNRFLMLNLDDEVLWAIQNPQAPDEAQLRSAIKGRASERDDASRGARTQVNSATKPAAIVPNIGEAATPGTASFTSKNAAEGDLFGSNRAKSARSPEGDRSGSTNPGPPSRRVQVLIVFERASASRSQAPANPAAPASPRPAAERPAPVPLPERDE